MNKIFAIIFGTRPEYLKLKSVIDEFVNKQLIHCKIIYVKQHSTIDENINCEHDILPIEKTNGGDRLCSIGEQIMAQLPLYISDCTHIIVQGDTATAFYSAICAFQLQKKVVHIEAGLRTYDLEKPFPEEAYRQMISRVACVHFTPHMDSSKLLLEEKVSGEIHMVGNTILDLISSYNLRCSMENVVMITFHRRENWDKIDILLDGLRRLTKKTPHIKYIWYLHHNPVLQLKVREAIKELPTVELQSPCNHKEFTQRIASSNFLITDSGGVQEEASFLGKHCVVLRASTERSHIPKQYITVLEDYSKLADVVENVPGELLEPCNVYGRGNSAKDIIKNLRLKTCDLSATTSYKMENISEIFNGIYINDKWSMDQSESKSGLGSTTKFTENVRKVLVNFIRENHINKMLDTSCGDWNWMKIIKNELCDYTGLDVVEHIIKTNNDKYSSNKIKFINCDFLSFIKNIPENQSYDLIFCRHTLEHLKTEYNLEFLNECKRVCKYLFVTGYNNINRKNEQLTANIYRPINLELEPYLSILEPYCYTKFYDGSYDEYKPEMYMYVYKFKTNFEVVDFRFLTINDDYDLMTYRCQADIWSRTYEYPFILNTLKLLNASKYSKIHNTSWGFEGCHVIFKNVLDKLYDNVFHSDIRPSNLEKTIVYDITKKIDDKYLNYFDFVLNVSTIEEVTHPHEFIINNLIEQLKSGGYLIFTFDYDENNCNTFGNGSINLNHLETILDKQINNKDHTNVLSGKNSIIKSYLYSHLKCGMVILQKTM